MSDKIQGLTVTLDGDYHEEDAQRIIAAISMVKGVAHVQEHIVDMDARFARQHALNRISEGIVRVLRDAAK